MKLEVLQKLNSGELTDTDAIKYVQKFAISQNSPENIQCKNTPNPSPNSPKKVENCSQVSLPTATDFLNKVMSSIEGHSEVVTTEQHVIEGL